MGSARLLQASLGKTLQNEKEIGNLLWTQTEKDNALAECRLGLRAWRTEKPMLCLHAVADEDGHPLEHEDESGRRLCDYWCTIFQARAQGPRHHQYENVLRYVQEARNDIRWVIDKKQSLKNSWQQRRNLLLALMEFRTAFTDVREGWVRGLCFAHTSMCWRVVPFLLICCRN